MKWPERSYLVDPFHGFVYCPIPKAGLSSVTTWFLQGIYPDLGEFDLDSPEAQSALEPFVLKSWGTRPAQKVLQNPQYFKFAIVRNPFSRLVSAFLNKFLPGKRVVRQPIRHMLARRKWGPGLYGDWAIACGWLADRITGQFKRHDAKVPGDLTFHEFVMYLADTDLRRVNRHWRPQHLFLEGCEFDFIGRLENLAEDFAQIQQQLGLEHPLPHLNSTQRQQGFGDSEECWAEMPLEHLQKMANFPNYTAFYSPELIQRVEAFYQQDLEQLGYDFNGPLTSGSTAAEDRKVA